MLRLEGNTCTCKNFTGIYKAMCIMHNTFYGFAQLSIPFISVSIRIPKKIH